jgi:hypothetical protein
MINCCSVRHLGHKVIQNDSRICFRQQIKLTGETVTTPYTSSPGPNEDAVLSLLAAGGEDVTLPDCESSPPRDSSDDELTTTGLDDLTGVEAVESLARCSLSCIVSGCDPFCDDCSPASSCCCSCCAEVGADIAKIFVLIPIANPPRH